jgi:hypothetical protein
MTTLASRYTSTARVLDEATVEELQLQLDLEYEQRLTEAEAKQSDEGK